MNCDPELALKYAKEKDPGNPFVLSCEQQYAKRGSLSAKQIAALYRVSATFTRSKSFETSSDDWADEEAEAFGEPDPEY
jgi:hypothetical protein